MNVKLLAIMNSFGSITTDLTNFLNEQILFVVENYFPNLVDFLALIKGKLEWVAQEKNKVRIK